MKIWIALGLSPLPMLLFPHWHLNWWAPLLTMLIYHLPLPSLLWSAFGCGFVMDLLGVDSTFGVYALNFTLTIALIYRLQQFFYKEQFFTIPLLTIVFGVVSTVLHGVLSLSDLVIMPLLDGLYALTWFTTPLWILFGRPAPARPFELVRPR